MDLGEETASTSVCDPAGPVPSQAAPKCSYMYKFKHPLFEEAGDFELRVQNSKVVLENCVHGQTDQPRTVTAYIRVRNISYNKDVFIRCTGDHWKTCQDLNASYVRSCGDAGQTQTDRFQCDIPIPETGGQVEFAIGYRVDGEEHWDNNYSANYCVTAHFQ